VTTAGGLIHGYGRRVDVLAVMAIAIMLGLGGLALGAVGAFVVIYVANGGPHGDGLGMGALAGAGAWFVACTGGGVALAVLLVRSALRSARRAEETSAGED
jgi:hypothetical protein